MGFGCIHIHFFGHWEQGGGFWLGGLSRRDIVIFRRTPDLTEEASERWGGTYVPMPGLLCFSGESPLCRSLQPSQLSLLNSRLSVGDT
jgi:hypothetical protein